MGTAAVTALLEVLAGNYPGTAKGHAAWAITFIGAEALEQLYGAMNSESADVRIAVVSAIANIAQEQEQADQSLLEVLASAVKDPAAVVRAEAASALGVLAPERSVPKLILLLEDASAEVRKAAALALGKIGDSVALPSLQVRQNDEVEEVRQVVALAISLINQKQYEDDDSTE
ncbi:MAG: HEAT repeat domain-containing protein [Symploca sp. SIO3C6]|nr:HEAT repeat domain-containing protein [Symploca sp. SIO3C6]